MPCQGKGSTASPQILEEVGMKDGRAIIEQRQKDLTNTTMDGHRELMRDFFSLRRCTSVLRT